MEHPLAVDFLRWIVLLPLLGAAINFLAGARLQRGLGKRAISIVGCGAVAAAFALAVYAWAAMLAVAPADRFMLDHLWRWIHVGPLRLDIAFWLDPLSMLMVLIITGVGGLIHIYSTGYMHEDESYWRFFAWLNLFTFAMLVLVLADNLWLMFVGWEGVGLCSFALIGFWYKELANTTAGNKAFIVNRVGDWAFVVALYSLFTGLGTAGHATLVIRDVAQGAPALAGMPGYFGMSLVTFVTLLLFAGATGKSAQIPLHVWLPDAMAGPTPVSALIHAATMVTAGVYMVARMNAIYQVAPLAMDIVAVVGALTAIFAASMAMVQTDIKKVLAYSTVSQLGYMMLALGVGGWVAGLFHLLTHAFFKALLFLGSGSVIYGCHHEQEMTKMGGLYPKMKITALTMLVGCLAIAGTPFFSGWYSKDAILANALGFVIVHKQHFLLVVLPLLTAGITTFYMFRMWFMTFAGQPRDHHVHEHAHESPRLMTVPLIILAVMSIMVAWGWPIWDSALEHHLHHAQHPAVMADFGFNKDIDTRWDPFAKDAQTGQPGTYVHTWRGDDKRNEEESVRVQAELHHHAIGNIALGVVLLAFALSASVYYFKRLDPADAREQFPGIYNFLANKWYFDAAYSVLLVRPALKVATWCRAFDTKVIDGAVDNTARAIGIWVILSSLLGASPAPK
jgi:NADH-quinone oxidoreductase subunit L